MPHNTNYKCKFCLNRPIQNDIRCFDEYIKSYGRMQVYQCNRKCKKGMTYCYVHRKKTRNILYNNCLLFNDLPIEIIQIIIMYLDYVDTIQFMHTSYNLRHTTIQKLNLRKDCSNKMCTFHKCEMSNCENLSKWIGMVDVCHDHVCKFPYKIVEKQKELGKKLSGAVKIRKNDMPIQNYNCSVFFAEKNAFEQMFYVSCSKHIRKIKYNMCVQRRSHNSMFCEKHLCKLCLTNHVLAVPNKMAEKQGTDSSKTQIEQLFSGHWLVMDVCKHCWTELGKLKKDNLRTYRYINKFIPEYEMMKLWDNFDVNDTLNRALSNINLHVAECEFTFTIVSAQ